MGIISSLTSIGTEHSTDPAKKLGIRLSNIISLIMFSLSLILFVLYYVWYGWNFVTYFIPFGSLVPLATLLYNRNGFTNLSRIWIATYVPILVTFVSIYSKYLYYNHQEDLDYFTFRFLILAACAFPPILFSLQERKLIIFCSLVCFLLLVGYDPLHNLFSVPFRHQQLNVESYNFTNIVVFITWCVLFGAVIFLKSIYERNESSNQQLIQQLNISNELLREKNEEIEEQASELLSQSEALNQNQTRLQEAYNKIEEQKMMLHMENEQLESELLKRNQELIQTNNELIQHNNELRQFSYTISHNLRGPVASLLGLSNLLPVTALDSGTSELIKHIKKSVERFDVIIKDLSKIIDIRHDIFKIRTKISLHDEIEDVKKILEKEISVNHVKFTGNYSNGVLYTVKPMIGSILYNLVTNSIKYRSPDRSPVIEINFETINNYYVIEVTDNGLGIDLKRYKDNVFRLYKRFHHHNEGKGLGLYLVKLQCESLGGSVAVESEVDKYTRFTIRIGVPQNVKEQILLEESYAKIFFDAELNSTGVLWKDLVTSEQYKSIYKKGIDFLQSYETPNWITDLRKQGPISIEDQSWLTQKVLPKAYEKGLRRVACIVPSNVEDERIKQYLDQLHSHLTSMGIVLEFFESLDDACEWIREENEKIKLYKSR